MLVEKEIGLPIRKMILIFNQSLEEHKANFREIEIGNIEQGKSAILYFDIKDDPVIFNFTKVTQKKSKYGIIVPSCPVRFVPNSLLLNYNNQEIYENFKKGKSLDYVVFKDEFNEDGKFIGKWICELRLYFRRLDLITELNACFLENLGKEVCLTTTFEDVLELFSQKITWGPNAVRLYLEGFSLKEIARNVGKKVGTVQNALKVFRGLSLDHAGVDMLPYRKKTSFK